MNPAGKPENGRTLLTEWWLPEQEKLRVLLLSILKSVPKRNTINTASLPNYRQIPNSEHEIEWSSSKKGNILEMKEWRACDQYRGQQLQAFASKSSQPPTLIIIVVSQHVFLSQVSQGPVSFICLCPFIQVHCILCPRYCSACYAQWNQVPVLKSLRYNGREGKEQTTNRIIKIIIIST